MLTRLKSEKVRRHAKFRARVLTSLVVIGAAVGAGAAADRASAEELAGSWRGGGSVSFLSGSKERARCRATYAKQSASSYAMSATCATASGSINQSTNLRKVGANSYRGSFHNLEYDTSGSISVTVHGGSQNVSISATKGSASLSLHR